MTKVKFFEDFHCFEYHTPREAAQRFRYFLYSPVYERIALFSMVSTQCDLACEKTVYSSDFLPSRLARRLQE
jgi:hypothetical protein